MLQHTCHRAQQPRSDHPCLHLERHYSVQVGQTEVMLPLCCLLAMEHPDCRDHHPTTVLLWSAVQYPLCVPNSGRLVSFDYSIGATRQVTCGQTNLGIGAIQITGTKKRSLRQLAILCVCLQCRFLPVNTAQTAPFSELANLLPQSRNLVPCRKRHLEVRWNLCASRWLAMSSFRLQARLRVSLRYQRHSGRSTSGCVATTAFP